MGQVRMTSVLVSTVFSLTVGATAASEIPIHRLDASDDKAYVEIQDVGEFPRRPKPLYSKIRRERTVPSQFPGCSIPWVGNPAGSW